MLKSISITGLRCINETFLFSPGINIICGNNGAGKSTILEAIHMLSFGRSFRTSKPDVMISHNADRFLIHATIEQNGLLFDIAIERQKGATQAKVNGDKSSLSAIAQLLPSIFVDTNTYRDFFEKSAIRRRFIDWMVFHVKPEHMKAVRRYNAALKSRNAALKAGMDVSPWDAILCDMSPSITLNRAEVVSVLNDLVNNNNHEFLTGLDICYSPGYNIETGLKQCLIKAAGVDRGAGRTSVGPHKSDIIITVSNARVEDMLSQGQLKSLFHQLVRSYKEFLTSAGKLPLVLIDDFQAELDVYNRQTLSDIVTGGQSVVTSIEKDAEIEGRLFHVEQ